MICENGPLDFRTVCHDQIHKNTGKVPPAKTFCYYSFVSEFLKLQPLDLSQAAIRLPDSVLRAVHQHQERLVIAGGYIRSIVSGEKVNDIDCFVDSVSRAKRVAKMIAGPVGTIHSSQNALTIPGRYTVQVIHRWVFDSPSEIIRSFDFTIARAALWWNKAGCQSLIDPRFYSDLAARRLVYTSPQRNEDAGGSLLRVLKFCSRGYRIPVDSMGAVVARLMNGLPRNADLSSLTEEEIADRFTQLLREVDPQVDPEHLAHLPAIQAKKRIPKKSRSRSSSRTKT